MEEKTPPQQLVRFPWQQGGSPDSAPPTNGHQQPRPSTPPPSTPPPSASAPETVVPIVPDRRPPPTPAGPPDSVAPAVSNYPPRAPEVPPEPVAAPQEPPNPAWPPVVPHPSRAEPQPPSGGVIAPPRPRPPVVPADVEPAALGVYEVPAPGRRLRTGRRRSWLTRLLLILTPMVLVGGALFIAGVGIGSSRVAAPATIAPDEAGRYGLTTYPTDVAAAYGQAYLEICLTHPVGDDDALRERETQLTAMSSSGVDSSCGWTGEGPAQSPTSVVYAGQIQPVEDGIYENGTAAYLTYIAALDTGARLSVTVPVWASELSPAAELRVVGQLGLVPLPAGGEPPAPEQPENTDAALASQLQPQLIDPFLTAWAASDTVQLDLVLTADATNAARTGLAGTVSEPAVQSLTALTSREPDEGRYTYVDGDEVQLLATVSWLADDGTDQRADYRITARLVAQRWLVVDIAGGGLDDQGGADEPEPSTEPDSEDGGSGSDTDQDGDTTPVPTSLRGNYLQKGAGL